MAVTLFIGAPDRPFAFFGQICYCRITTRRYPAEGYFCLKNMKNFKGNSPNNAHISTYSEPFKAGVLLVLIAFFMGTFGAFGVEAAGENISLQKDSFGASTSATGASTVLSVVGGTSTISLVTHKTHKVWVTAYSSTPDETDDTPFTTAMGTRVHVGIVATNLLPFGTKIMIPALFGKNVFVVEDRMHERKKNNIDIWMPSKREALRFGARYAEIVVLKQESELLSQR